MREVSDHLRKWLRRLRTNADIEEELYSHVQMEADDYVTSGMSVCEAERKAKLKLGSSVSIKERIGDQEITTLLEGYWRDIAFGFRALRKTPVFSITAVLTLAFGIGANTAIFTLLYGLLFHPLPAKNSSKLAEASVLLGDPNDAFQSGIPYRLAEEYRREQHSFSQLSFWDTDTVAVRDHDGTLRSYSVGFASANAFDVLGMKPQLGRWIRPEEDVRGGPARGWPVVLSYGFWNDHFGADRNVIGKRIEISGVSAVVVGVVPPAFHGIYRGQEMKAYMPLHFASVPANQDVLDDPKTFYWVSAIGRLRPGVTVGEANKELRTAGQRLLNQFVPLEAQQTPEFKRAMLKVRSAATGLSSNLAREYSEPLFIMQGLVAAVLVLCCINVGGLMTARVYTRQREFALRSAIGAERWRLVRQYLTESLVIGISGALLGAAAAWFGTPALLQFFRDPMMFEAVSIQPDATVFWVSGAAALATTILFGTVPAMRAGRADAASLLNTRTSLGARRQIAGRMFLPLQAALSLVLLAVAILLSQSLVRLRSQHTGFEVDHVTIQTPPFHRLHLDWAATLDLYQRMVDRIEQMPGIRSAAVTWFTPLTGSQLTGHFTSTTQSTSAFRNSTMAFNMVGSGYFRTMQTHIRKGREFQSRERNRGVCILNESAAQYLFPHGDAINSYVRNETAEGLPQKGVCRVVGIAEDAKFSSLRQVAPRTIYYPVSTDARLGNLVFLINSDTKLHAIDAYRKAIGELAPTIPLVLFVTMRDQLNAALGSQRLITILSDLFAVLALFLSAIGLYGLLSASVAQRTGEIGMRIALGARTGNVLRLILVEAIGLLGAGLLVGAVGLFFGVRAVQSMLFGVSQFDPAGLTGSVCVLGFVMLAAAAPPALRAASVDPMTALRTE